jgi:hypothetical protein
MLARRMVTSLGDDFPRMELSSGELAVSLYLPDAERGYYRGTRFDHAGIVRRVEHAGHRFYAPLYPVHDPHRHDSICGPVDEFAMFEPMGFAEAEEGEPFVKIGVGLLRKGSSDTYRFDGRYPVARFGAWETEGGGDRVSFTQELRGGRGWAYRYVKTVRLLPGEPVMALERHLENRGDRTIDIVQYNHNFTLIDGLPYGPGYRVMFPFEAATPRRIQDVGWFRGHAIELDRPLGQRSLWLPVFEGDDPGGYHAARICNLESGAAVELNGDAPITRMVFWAVERAVCPEPFLRVHLPPGASMTWTTRYRFSAGGPASG